MILDSEISGDDHAQIHVLESVIAGLLFFGALQVGINLVPDSQSTTALDTLSVTGEDALRTLYLLTPDIPDAAAYGNSSLIYYIVTGQVSNITDFLNSSLSSTTSYRLSYRIQPGSSETLLYDMMRTVDESVTSHFAFYHEGVLYDVRIVLWHEPRGVV